MSHPSWIDRLPDAAALEPAARVRLGRLVPTVVATGTTVFRPGQAVLGYIILLSGRIEVRLVASSGRELLLYTVEPGAACVQSTLGLLGGDANYSAEAVAVEPAEAVIVPRPDFMALLDVSPAFRRMVLGSLARRIQSTMRELERAVFEPLDARLARTLLARADRSGTVRATHRDLAAAIGSAREVVSRRLKAWAKAGDIEIARGRIRILRPERLEAIRPD